MLSEILFPHLLRPYWLLALIPVILLWVLIRYRRRSTDPWQTVCDPTLLTELYKQQSIAISQRSHWLSWAVLLGCILIVFSLAGPSWQKDNIPLYQRTQARVIVFDLSNAMTATDIKPQRLIRARYKVLDLLKQLTEGETGMVAFAQEAYVVSPLTQDTQTIAAMMSSLTPNIMPAPGHNITAGLIQAQRLLKATSSEKNAYIILLTADNPTADDFATAKTLHQNGITLLVIGIGSTQAVPTHDQHGQINMNHLNQQKLAQLAQAGGGIYVPFRGNNHDLQQITQRMMSTTSTKQKTQHTSQHFRDQGRWLLIPALLIILIGFRRGWLVEAIR